MIDERIVASRPLTAELNAERSPEAVRGLFESAFSNAPIGMALIDMDDHWIQVQQRTLPADRLFGDRTEGKKPQVPYPS